MCNKKINYCEIIDLRSIPAWIFAFFVMIFAWHNSTALTFTGENQISAESLGRIIILEEGRKKPLDTYARNKLVQFSGKQKVSGLSALEWFSRLLLNPDEANDDLIFLIDNPEVADALGISPRARRRYCFSELYEARERLGYLSNESLKKERVQWTTFDKEIVTTDRNLQEYFLIRSAFSLLEPLPFLEISDSSLALNLELPVNQPISYFQLLKRAGIMAEKMKCIQSKGTDSLNSEELALVDLTRKMYDMEKSLENPPPHLIPDIKNSGDEWLGIWGLVNQHKSTVLKHRAMIYLIQIRDAYLNGDQKKFDESVVGFNDYVKQYTSNGEKLPDPSLELLYNKLNPFFFAKILYGLAALMSLLSISLAWRKVYSVAFVFVLNGVVLHTAGIIIRMIIMSHPPVTNLYETFVFTAWAAVIIGIVLEWLKIGSVGTITAAITGFLFVHIAGKYAGDGDTMGMLVAVLDSSFWLTTHIVTISLGYAGYIGAGLVGHIYLINKMIKPDNTVQLQNISRAVKGIFYFGLLFTVVGTMFGGMWADQAWGRFWGWDPKENGALLLIIWGLIVIHTRMGGMIKDTGYAIGAVVGTILVMSAWIGVNLLGVGLHTYGFTSSGALTLFIYIGAEILFLAFCAIVINKKQHPQILNNK